MDRQLELREAYGHYLDSLSPACSMQTKIERFRHWLEKQGIIYSTSSQTPHLTAQIGTAGIIEGYSYYFPWEERRWSI